MLLGGDHEERAAASPGAPRSADGAAPGTDPGEGLPQTLHRDRVSNASYWSLSNASNTACMETK